MAPIPMTLSDREGYSR